MNNSNSREDLLRHGFLLLAAQQVGNVANALFQMVAGRMLSKAEYSILFAMLSMIMICSAPILALRTSLSYYAARLVQTGRLGEVRLLLRRWMGYILLFGLPFVVAIVLFREAVMDFQNIDRPAPVLAMAVALFLMLFMTIQAGAFIGLQAFRWFVVSISAYSLLRMAFAVVYYYYFDRTATWGLLAQVTAILFFFALATAGLSRILRVDHCDEVVLPDTAPYFFQSCLFLSSFAVLMNADIILVRHLFPEEDAGTFAYAATIGRAVIFLPMPIAMAMFPKVSSDGSSGKEDVRTLYTGLGMAGGFIGAAIAVCLIVPAVPVSILFRSAQATPEVLRMVRLVVLALSPLSLGFVLMNFEMAQRRFRAVPIALVLAAGYIAGVFIFHDSTMQVVAVMAVVNVVFLLALLIDVTFGLSKMEAMAS